jgi:hypothetical protein
MIFGSHLYGTDSENSDKDYKGVFMPSLDMVLLGRIPKSISTSSKSGNDGKNTPEDVDSEMYSLHYFIDLASRGETVALDMLHAPPNMLLSTTPIWESIVSERSRFYTKRISTLVSYAVHQAAKYGVKGSRLSEASTLLSTLEGCDSTLRLSDIADKLPIGEHTRVDGDFYVMCGKKLHLTTRVSYNIDIVRSFVGRYGKRAEMASRNEGVDWKAISHAFRACYQCIEIVEEGTITYPLRMREFIKDVKYGKYEYEYVGTMLDDLLDEAKSKLEGSDLPESVDRVWWDNFIIRVTREVLCI